MGPEHLQVRVNAPGEVRRDRCIYGDTGLGALGRDGEADDAVPLATNEVCLDIDGCDVETPHRVALQDIDYKTLFMPPRCADAGGLLEEIVCFFVEVAR